MSRSGRNPKSPAFQWYPTDAMTDERYASMTYEERGVFHALLDYAWLNDGLPNDLDRLARLLRLAPADFERIWPAVSRCFREREGDPSRLVNGRQERERRAQVEFSSKMRGNATKTNAKRTPRGTPGATPRDTPRARHASREAIAESTLPNPLSSILNPVCVSEQHAHTDPIPIQPDLPAPRPSWQDQLGMHPTLDTPAVRVALDRWEAHLRDGGRRPKTGSSWAASFVQWERWGPSRLVKAIDCTISANAFTVFEPRFEDKPDPKPAGQPSREPEPPDADDVRRRWERAHRRKMPHPLGAGTIEVVDPWPGYEAAKAELEGKVPA